MQTERSELSVCMENFSNIVTSEEIVEFRSLYHIAATKIERSESRFCREPLYL